MFWGDMVAQWVAPLYSFPVWSAAQLTFYAKLSCFLSVWVSSNLPKPYQVVNCLNCPTVWVYIPTLSVLSTGRSTWTRTRIKRLLKVRIFSLYYVYSIYVRASWSTNISNNYIHNYSTQTCKREGNHELSYWFKNMIWGFMVWINQIPSCFLTHV